MDGLRDHPSPANHACPERATEDPGSEPRPRSGPAELAAPHPFLKRLTARPHPSRRPTRFRLPQAATPAGAARGLCSLAVSLGLPRVGDVWSRPPVPAPSFAPPCSAGDGPPSCMLTLLRHFRKWRRLGGSSASCQGQVEGLREILHPAACRDGTWHRGEVASPTSR